MRAQMQDALADSWPGGAATLADAVPVARPPACPTLGAQADMRATRQNGFSPNSESTIWIEPVCGAPACSVSVQRLNFEAVIGR